MSDTVQIIVHPNHLGGSDGEGAVNTALRMIAWANATSNQRNDGWVDKYGINFENDTFLMHCFCWCEKEGECPWCTGCGYYEANGLCQACRESYPHSPTCYQTELNDARKAAGLSHSVNEKYVEDTVKRDYDERRKLEDRIYSKLCKKHGLDSEYGAAVHCDCGADEERKKAIGERGCDYAFGRGIFARFAPYQQVDERRYYDPPNFWYKPTDFRVMWYKYIGRDTATNRELAEGELERIIKDCVPNPAEAFDAVKEIGTGRAEQFAQMIEGLCSGSMG